MATTKITSPDLFDLGSLNTALQLPSGTTAERPTSPSTGEWRYNTTTNLIEFYDGGSWRDLQSEDIPPIPSENFNTVLYDGNGSTNNITGVGFQPDLVWIKQRDTAVENHNWYDSTRGVQNFLVSNSTAAQVAGSSSRLNAFGSDGFTVGGDNEINDSGSKYVAWCWKANGGTTSSNTDGTQTSTVQVNAKAGFSIVQWTSSAAGSSETVGHGLGTTPAVIILKRTDSTEDWYVWHEDLGGGGSSALNEFLKLNDTSTESTATNLFNTVNSTVFNPSYTNGVPNTNIAYCFAEKAGYSSFGSYTGNASDNGPIVNTGFEPAWLMIKGRTSAVDGWFMVDNKRDTSNPRGIRLFANSTVGEASESGAQVDFFTNGFQIRGSGGGQGQVNSSGANYIYLAFAATSSTSTLADSFNSLQYAGNSSSQSITGVGFSPSFLWIKQINGSEQHYLYDTIRGSSKYLHSNLTSAEGTDATTRLTSFDSDGFSLGSDGAVNGSGSNYISWNWKANSVPTINTDGGIQSIVNANQAAGISIVKWDGTGSASTVGHGLSAAPEIILTKRLNGVGDWYSFSVFANGGTTPANYFLKLNSSDAETLNTGSPPSVFAGTVPTATVFSVGTTLSGSSSDSYIAYCFASISGFSKIGTYTGNSSTQSITGLGFQPNWLMIKQTNGSNSWRIFDSARGLSAPQTLFANSSSQEDSESNTVSSFDSDGWTMGSQQGVNDNGDTYLYIAFKANLTPQPLAGFMSFLVIAGGAAGGGESNSGGGGAGGLRTSYGPSSGGGSSAESNITLASGTYTITVGAGGGGGSTAGGNGSVSSIAASGLTTIESTGGGGGVGQFGNPSGVAGGSGGGGGYNNQAGGAGTANQGFAGGSGTASGAFPGGGGGGASEAGNTDGAGYGGDGLSVEITASAVAYAGGGSGGVSAGNTAIPGSDGGGGSGASGDATAPVAGTAYLGAGGGGGAASTTGANGGSGVVVLRLLTSEYSGTTTGSPTVTTDGVHTVLKYNGSGTYVHS